ncbi:MAG: energy transducer TonB [Acidobacteriia bacterium]|nr:energy transducer TonB [Terriglobia bacterium]
MGEGKRLHYLRNLQEYHFGPYPLFTMTSLKWGKTTIIFLLLCGVFCVVSGSVQSQDATEGARKVLYKRPPRYPDIARKMSITGIVKVEAVIAPNGVVKSLAVKGGHPLLAQAAQDAIHDWKWEAASHETRELIEVKFETPQ